MSKPIVSLRPSPRLDPADAFVMAAASSERSEAVTTTPASATPVVASPRKVSPVKLAPPMSVQPSSRRTVLARKDGRELRRMTVYMPLHVARRLTVSCAEQEVDISDLVTQLVAAHLGV